MSTRLLAVQWLDAAALDAEGFTSRPLNDHRFALLTGTPRRCRAHAAEWRGRADALAPTALRRSRRVFAFVAALYLLAAESPPVSPAAADRAMAAARGRS